MDMLWKRSKTKAELKSEVRFVLRIGRAFSIILGFDLGTQAFSTNSYAIGKCRLFKSESKLTHQAKSCMQRNQIPWLLT